jgi:hypothetical protein
VILRVQEGDEDALDYIAKPDGSAVGGPSTEPINARLPAALGSRKGRWLVKNSGGADAGWVNSSPRAV